MYVPLCMSALRVKRSGVQPHVPPLQKMLRLETLHTHARTHTHTHARTHTHTHNHSVTKPEDDVRLQYKLDTRGRKEKKKDGATRNRDSVGIIKGEGERNYSVIVRLGAVLAVCVGK